MQMNEVQETTQPLPAHCLSPSTPGSARALFCFRFVLIGQMGPGGSVDATYSLTGAPSAARCLGPSPRSPTSIHTGTKQPGKRTLTWMQVELVGCIWHPGKQFFEYGPVEGFLVLCKAVASCGSVKDWGLCQSSIRWSPVFLNGFISFPSLDLSLGSIHI